MTYKTNDKSHVPFTMKL